MDYAQQQVSLHHTHAFPVCEQSYVYIILHLIMCFLGVYVCVTQGGCLWGVVTGMWDAQCGCLSLGLILNNKHS